MDTPFHEDGRGEKGAGKKEREKRLTEKATRRPARMMIPFSGKQGSAIQPVLISANISACQPPQAQYHPILLTYAVQQC
jgi:hypothetical protein